MRGKLYVEACIDFSAAHKITGHYKCGNIHGHNYRVCVKISEQTPMEIDLDELKPLLRREVHDRFDHTYLNKSFCKAVTKAECEYDTVTSEDLAEYIYMLFSEKYPGKEIIVKVCETKDLCVYYAQTK